MRTDHVVPYGPSGIDEHYHIFQDALVEYDEPRCRVRCTSALPVVICFEHDTATPTTTLCAKLWPLPTNLDRATLGQKLRMFSTLTPDQAIAPELLIRIAAVLSDALVISEQRNRYIHAQWMFASKDIHEGRIQRLSIEIKPAPRGHALDFRQEVFRIDELYEFLGSIGKQQLLFGAFSVSHQWSEIRPRGSISRLLQTHSRKRVTCYAVGLVPALRRRCSATSFCLRIRRVVTERAVCEKLAPSSGRFRVVQRSAEAD